MSIQDRVQNLIVFRIKAQRQEIRGL